MWITWVILGTCWTTFVLMCKLDSVFSLDEKTKLFGCCKDQPNILWQRQSQTLWFPAYLTEHKGQLTDLCALLNKLETKVSVTVSVTKYLVGLCNIRITLFFRLSWKHCRAYTLKQKLFSMSRGSLTWFTWITWLMWISMKNNHFLAYTWKQKLFSMSQGSLTWLIWITYLMWTFKH